MHGILIEAQDVGVLKTFIAPGTKLPILFRPIVEKLQFHPVEVLFHCLLRTLRRCSLKKNVTERAENPKQVCPSFVKNYLEAASFLKFF